MAKDVETGKISSVQLKASGRLTEDRLEQLSQVTDAVVTAQTPLEDDAPAPVPES